MVNQKINLFTMVFGILNLFTKILLNINFEMEFPYYELYRCINK